ncbi:hypothetical protein EXIGLDRAFT_717682 [Exidia glandulosa HHB12029]|uniref:Uncharacterized protein n=1 Tax=Exidia glandulosa HHB12029 TaxID=1314781 RepID=A0A165I812_EXIGL|nr:hypothetical protein EXIGLDRAFT_717682 [Exidia glandulosa HHB12029]
MSNPIATAPKLELLPTTSIGTADAGPGLDALSGSKDAPSADLPTDSSTRTPSHTSIGDDAEQQTPYSTNADASSKVAIDDDDAAAAIYKKSNDGTSVGEQSSEDQEIDDIDAEDPPIARGPYTSPRSRRGGASRGSHGSGCRCIIS